MLHDVTTGGAAHRPHARGGGQCFGRRTRVRVCYWCWSIGGLRGELRAQRFEFFTMGRTKEAIVTHLDKALGQDMLQETVDEFLGGQRAVLRAELIGGVRPE